MTEVVAEAREQWGSSLEFILTVVGFAVGLGNVWRFPYLVFNNGGGAFLVIFFLMLFLVGIPIFFLELSIGQFSGLGPTHVFYRMAPLFQGLGYAALTINAFIGFYYNVIIAYCFYYLIMSLRSKLPWSSCDQPWNTENCAIRTNFSVNCSVFQQLHPNPRSPSEEYFYKQVLKISDGIDNLGSIDIPIAIALFASWATVFIALSKGVQSLGKVSYFTATFPYVMLTVLVITGSLLSGAGIGVDYYVGTVNTAKFLEPSVWKDATVQVFYALSECTGGLIAMSSFNNFKNNILRDTLLIPILDCLTGFYAGFAIFTVLGHMYITKCVNSMEDVASAGPELAFIVYPEGLSLIKAVPPLWSILFFLMMLALGFGSEFSIMETFMVMVMDLFKKTINTKKKKILTRLLICIVFFLFGLSMTTKGGFYILSLIDNYIAGYPLLAVGLLQVIVVPWIYGTDRLIDDIESMIGPKPKWFWKIWTISWKFISPIVLIGVIIATVVIKGKELTVNHVTYPGWSHFVGWIIVAIPFALLIGCAIAQMYIHKFDWVKLLSPDPAYYENYRKNCGVNINHDEQELSSKVNDQLDKVDFAKENEAYSNEDENGRKSTIKNHVHIIKPIETIERF